MSQLKDYAEIDSFVWREEENFSFHGIRENEMSPKSNANFGNLIVTFSPDFVRNIECSVTGGQLVSILPPKNDFECYFVQQNNKFIKSISYPNNAVPKRAPPKIVVTENGDKEAKKTATLGTNTVPVKPERHSNPSVALQTRYEKKAQPIRSEVPEKLKHAESKDSLVTQSLLNLTSYEAQVDEQVDYTLNDSARQKCYTCKSRFSPAFQMSNSYHYSYTYFWPYQPIQFLQQTNTKNPPIIRSKTTITVLCGRNLNLKLPKTAKILLKKRNLA